MRIGSLFSGGCGGLELGLERAGVGHVLWQCEIDAAARRNLARHWPGVKQYPSGYVGYANGARLEGRSVLGCGRADERAFGAAGSEVADAKGERPQRRSPIGAATEKPWLDLVRPDVGGVVHDFPPGPGDLDGWREYLARFPNRAPAMLTPMPANRHGNARRNMSLNPFFVEALMGFPEGWTQGTRSERLKQLGNAVVPQCAEVVGHVLIGLRDRLR